jgi:hypothetical protein
MTGSTFIVEKNPATIGLRTGEQPILGQRKARASKCH